jgi:hypothetical protein
MDSYDIRWWEDYTQICDILYFVSFRHSISALMPPLFGLIIWLYRLSILFDAVSLITEIRHSVFVVAVCSCSSVKLEIGSVWYSWHALFALPRRLAAGVRVLIAGERKWLIRGFEIANLMRRQTWLVTDWDLCSALRLSDGVPYLIQFRPALMPLLFILIIWLHRLSTSFDAVSRAVWRWNSRGGR